VSAPLIDIHTHVFPSAAVGAWVKSDCEIWEYGHSDEVPYSPIPGDMYDLRATVRECGLDYVVAVNCFSIEEWQDRSFRGLTDGLARSRPRDGAPGSVLVEWLVGVNEWLVEATAADSALIPFVAIDPWVLPAPAAIPHLTHMRESGARGVKLHPVAQRCRVDDEATRDLLRACADLDLVVLAHSGAARGQVPFAEPSTFRALHDIPNLRIIIAHLGGGCWTQISKLAVDLPGAMFDLSEIIAWAGAPNAPTRTQLVELIRDVGVDRVLFGSDFPWYAPDEMMVALRELPGISDAECEAIQGGNAARLLSLAG